MRKYQKFLLALLAAFTGGATAAQKAVDEGLMAPIYVTYKYQEVKSATEIKQSKEHYRWKLCKSNPNVQCA